MDYTVISQGRAWVAVVKRRSWTLAHQDAISLG